MKKTYDAGHVLKVEFLGCEAAPAASLEKLARVYDALISGREDFTGWVVLPAREDADERARVAAAAARIRAESEVFVTVGIGGSYLGARAAADMLGVYEADPKAPELMFAGQNISGSYHAALLDSLRGKDFSLCVVSKSGTTTEPNIAFAILKDLLREKYGAAGAAKRIYAVTDPASGSLRAEADAEGYTSFVIPPNIGGRYSVLTPVGTLPMAVAGFDTDAVLAGARRAGEPDMRETAARLACARHALLESGKAIEVFEYYEPALFAFAEWLKQLFGESEGKDGKGLFPAALMFSTDLHSMGQFLQEGNQIFFETVLDVKNPPRDVKVPDGADPLLAGRRMNEVNRAATEGVIAAHRAAGIPIVRVDVPDLSPYTFGQMVYFFELTCAFTGRLMGVDPFNQPGVEQYKKEMKRVLRGK